jgi:hypothetical protein
MSNKMSVSGIADEFRKAFEALKTETTQVNKQTVSKMVNELKAVTPIDTGLAKSSWKTVESLNGTSVENTAEYIQYLNEGSSKQAPARFIEATALKYGVPLGTIVEVKQGN